MSRTRRAILWAAGGMAFVFAINAVLAWATAGYLDGAVLARMAVMLAPVLAVAGLLFAFAGGSGEDVRPAAASVRRRAAEEVAAGRR